MDFHNIFAYVLGVCLFIGRADSRRRRKITDDQQSARDGLTGLLLESLRAQRAQACDGEKLTLRCPSHTHLHVEGAFYGRVVPSASLCPPSEKTLKRLRGRGGTGALGRQAYEDTSCDVADARTKVADKCETKRKCRVPAKPRFFERDPCPTTSKYLQLSYKCQPSQFTNEQFCEGTSMHLSCRPGKRIAVYSAVYGFAPSDVQPCGVAAAGQQQCTKDVVHLLLSRCHAQKDCSFAVRDEIMGNPCRSADVNKYLNLIFICVAEDVFNEAALEGRWEDIIGEHARKFPDDEQTRALIGRAPMPAPPVDEQTTMNNDDWSCQLTAPTLSAADGARSAAVVPHVVVDERTRMVEKATPTAPTAVVAPSTSLPSGVPNIIALIELWRQMALCIRDRWEKAALYFCLSASTGLVALLIGCIVKQCVSMRQSDDAAASTVRGYNVDVNASTYAASLYGSVSRGGVVSDDFERNKASYMRFNQLTPPRSHYYS